MGHAKTAHFRACRPGTCFLHSSSYWKLRHATQNAQNQNASFSNPSRPKIEKNGSCQKLHIPCTTGPELAPCIAVPVGNCSTQLKTHKTRSCVPQFPTGTAMQEQVPSLQARKCACSWHDPFFPIFGGLEWNHALKMHETRMHDF